MAVTEMERLDLPKAILIGAMNDLSTVNMMCGLMPISIGINGYFFNILFNGFINWFDFFLKSRIFP